MMNSIKAIRRNWIGALAILVIVPAAAHHSSAMYELQRTVVLKGKITAFYWKNPHCSIDLLVLGPNGEEQWNIQLGPPTKLYQEDWKPIMYKPGDFMTAIVNPMRDGTHRGLYVSGTGADGKPK